MQLNVLLLQPDFMNATQMQSLNKRQALKRHVTTDTFAWHDTKFHMQEVAQFPTKHTWSMEAVQQIQPQQLQQKRTCALAHRPWNPCLVQNEANTTFNSLAEHACCFDCLLVSCCWRRRDISNAGGEVVSGVCATFVRNNVAIEVAPFGGYANSKSLF